MTEITQADRDAADALRATSPIRDYIREEAMDEAFARHREQAEQETVAKIVAWLRERHDGGLTNRIYLADAIEAGEYRNG